MVRQGPLASPRNVYTYVKSLVVSSLSLFDGMLVTLRHFFSKPVTQQYPHEMRKLPERTRGSLCLRVDTEKMRSRCTACLVCEVVCPNNSIHIELVKDEKNKKKYLKEYRWDADKCIYCGLCVEGCKFDSLAWIPDFEHAVADKRRLKWDEREMMAAWLKNSGKWIDVKKVKRKWY